MMKKIFQIGVCLMVLGLGSTLAFADSTNSLKDQQLKVLESLEKARTGIATGISVWRFQKLASDALADCLFHQKMVVARIKTATEDEKRFVDCTMISGMAFKTAAYYIYDCRIEKNLNSCEKYSEPANSGGEYLDKAWKAFRVMHPEP